MRAKCGMIFFLGALCAVLVLKGCSKTGESAPATTPDHKLQAATGQPPDAAQHAAATVTDHSETASSTANSPDAGFDALNVHWESNWTGPGTLIIHGDGTYDFSQRKGLLEAAYDRASYRLLPEHRSELEALLKATGWLAPSAAAVYRDWAVDATTYTLTLVRHGRESKVMCCGGQPDQTAAYNNLLRFIERIRRQESLFRKLSGSPDERSFSAHEISSEIDALQREGVSSSTRPRLPVLDYHRLVPVFAEWLAAPDERSEDELAAAAKVMGAVKEEPQRQALENMALGRVRTQPANDSPSVMRIEAVRALALLGGRKSKDFVEKLSKDENYWVLGAVAEALVQLEGAEAAPLLAEMAVKSNEAAWTLIRLGDTGIPTIVKTLLEEDARSWQSASWRIVREYHDHWQELPQPLDPRVVAAIRDRVDRDAGRGTNTVEYGLNVLKWAGRPYRVPNVREALETFLLAVALNDEKTLECMMGNLARQSPAAEELLRKAGADALAVLSVYANRNSACAVLDDAAAGKQFVLHMHLDGGLSWRLSEPLYTTPDRAVVYVAQFFLNHPDAKPLPPAAALDETEAH